MSGKTKTYEEIPGICSTFVAHEDNRTSEASCGACVSVATVANDDTLCQSGENCFHILIVRFAEVKK